jgi:Type I restriction modification DNA specificity domain
MEVRPGYKLTDVGVIPEEWAAPRLDSLGAGVVPPIKAGPFGSSLTKDQYVTEGFKVYGQEQVIRGDHLFGDYFISADKYRELESCSVRPGDILLSLVGTAGKLLEVPDDAPMGVINPRLVRFSFDRNKVLPKFFKYQFESDTVQSLLSRQAQGGTMGVLNGGALRPFRIPLPPMHEQRAIAAALSDVDALLGGLDRLITKKRDLKQAAMQQLLTGQTRLPGFHGEWEVRKIGDFADCTAGGTPSTRVASYWGGSIRWMSSGELNLKRLDEVEGRITETGLYNSSATMLPVKCVLIGLAGQGKTRGTIAMNFVELCTNQSRPRKNKQLLCKQTHVWRWWSFYSRRIVDSRVQERAAGPA